MDDDDWLDYRRAAERVGRSEREIRRWAAAGMRTELRGGRRYVELTVLLAWWRERLKASPVHQARMRKLATQAPVPDPEPVLSASALAGLRARLPQRPEPAVPEQLLTDRDFLGDPEPTDPEQVPARPVVDEVLERAQLRRGEAEYAALVAALEVHRPACAGDTRFTRDGIAADVLRPVCASCPVLEPCRAFAAVAHPAGGVWAA